MKKIISIALVAMIFSSLIACSKIDKVDPYAKEEIVMQDYPVYIDNIQFDKTPQTVISLSPALTEIIFEIGFGDKIIAKSKYCDYPEEASSIQSVGSPAKPDIDEILKLQPDLVVTQSVIASVDINRLERAGIKVLVIPNANSFFELMDVYGRLSHIFLGNNSADEMTNQKMQSLDSELYNVQQMNSIGSFVFITAPNMAVATGDTLPGDILSVYGENIAKDYVDYVMSVEDIVQANPDIVFISSEVDISLLPEEIRELSAIVEERVITIDYSLFERPTSRLATLVQDITSKASEYVTQSEIPEPVTEENTDIDEETSTDNSEVTSN